MKKHGLPFAVAFALIAFTATGTTAQDENSGPDFTVGADVYSNYIWRGSKLGNGPAIQPSVKFIAGGLTLGVWGSFDASGYMETDPYFSYTLPFGLSVGMTDYYFPNLGGSFFSDSSNAYEINIGYVYKGLSLSANYIINEATLAASKGSDLYFQASYAFRKFNITVGAGDGWHTSDQNFNVCHVGIGTSKIIEINEKFSVPVTGQVIVNPEREQIFVVVGFSL